MKLISHRGNIDHINPSHENSPDYIQEAINKSFDVEVDCWVTNHTLYLGHDKPDYPITLNGFNNTLITYGFIVKIYLH